MANTGKCPQCDNLITHLKREPIAAEPPFDPSTRLGLYSLLCPFCSTILSVSVSLSAIVLDTEVLMPIKRALNEQTETIVKEVRSYGCRLD